MDRIGRWSCRPVGDLTAARAHSGGYPIAWVIQLYLVSAKTPGVPEASQPSTKECPRCAETVKAAAMICRFCSYEFFGPDDPTPVAEFRRTLAAVDKDGALDPRQLSPYERQLVERARKEAVSIPTTAVSSCYCPVCRQTVPSDSDFCKHCGLRLTESRDP